VQVSNNSVECVEYVGGVRVTSQIREDLGITLRSAGPRCGPGVSPVDESVLF